MSVLAEYERYDGIGLAELVRKGDVGAGELLDAAIERVQARNPAVNAVVARFDDAARAAIRAGLPTGPFSGVPYLLKDLGANYAGTVTSYGSRFFADNRAAHDSTLTQRLKRAGLVIFGKTNTPEFGLCTSTEPALFGATRNPWNLDYSAGGSSGGAAAAVAAGMLPMAHASDGGGSIRVPASCCGLVGLKPTRARIPSGPDRGEGWSGCATSHAITRTVRDSAALLDATAGPDVGDPYWAPPPAGPFLREVGRDPGRLRIALTTTPFNGVPVSPECAQAAHAAAKLCEQLGHHVEEARPVIDEAAFGNAFRVIVAGNVLAQLEERAAVLGRAATAADVERVTWSNAQWGRATTAGDYAAAITVLHAIGRRVGQFFAGYDVLLSPTMCQPPYRLGVLDMNTQDSAGFLAALLASVGFTSLFNVAGNPAISLPLGSAGNGLPIGVQFAGRFGDEATLLRLAAQIEVAQPWAQRRAPVVAS